MRSARNVFLIGMMGAGKTTAGRLLARRLKRPFFDSDLEVERRCGVKVPVIFEIEGEAGFRARETAVVGELTTHVDIVLATGGGAVLAESNRAALATRGTVVPTGCNPAWQPGRVSQ
jgi:shikimate kinase